MDILTFIQSWEAELSKNLFPAGDAVHQAEDLLHSQKSCMVEIINLSEESKCVERMKNTVQP